MRFVDTDKEIENEIGCSIKAFFEQHGEARFREIESNVLQTLCLRRGIVLATGGGAVLARANREVLLKHTVCVYLSTTPEQLMYRLRGDQTRPLLQVHDPLTRLRTLFEQRDPLYREVAHLVVETGKPSVNTVVNKIAMQLEMTFPQFMTRDYAKLEAST
jgi:shikimate kinase